MYCLSRGTYVKLRSYAAALRNILRFFSTFAKPLRPATWLCTHSIRFPALYTLGSRCTFLAMANNDIQDWAEIEGSYWADTIKAWVEEDRVMVGKFESRTEPLRRQLATLFDRREELTKQLQGVKGKCDLVKADLDGVSLQFQEAKQIIADDREGKDKSARVWFNYHGARTQQDEYTKSQGRVESSPARSGAAHKASATNPAMARLNTTNRKTKTTNQHRRSERKDDDTNIPSDQGAQLGHGRSPAPFACPFYLHDRHGWYDCLRKYTLNRIVDVRLHLCRVHLLQRNPGLIGELTSAPNSPDQKLDY
ncbi:hypothetical protein F5883DRAFT_153528 [Diaporthe sp. PMI_573]|nr:hypothetical protein F5883DRAFT_153528 [Diaporthaceae sp. PMI_573]